MAKPYRARRWRMALPDPAACWLLSRELGVAPITAQLLYNRGLITPEAAHRFLTAGREQILDPFLLKDMDRAVPLIKDRIASGQPIMVYGDYDVDGVTGTTILVLALRAMGAQVEYYIPNRFSEGYGLNADALTSIRARGFDFVLSVDTGVSAVAEAEVARALGITLVISDHHEPGPVLPAAAALINPKRPDCGYPFKGLSGVGVAFKLAIALGAPNAWELIDIVTLGTIADMVPLIGENRAIVREGLAKLGATTRPGLRALMEIAGVKQPVTATHIGFALGPRINALGRMGSAMAGVELFTTNDETRARELARQLDDENRNRQEVEAAILEQALAQVERQAPHEKEFVIVLAGEGWHHGVVGICASRVLEAYHRPVILLSIDGDEVRGSARSIPAFHLHRALSQVADLFTKFGGHAAAAGMTLKSPDGVAHLRERLNRLAAEWLRPEDLVPELRVDALVDLDQVNDDLIAELRALEPHGIGNPGPVFAIQDVHVVDSRTLGKEQQHIKLMLKGRGVVAPMEAVGWNMAPVRPSAMARVQAAFHPEINTYMGRSKLQLTMKDVQVIDAPDDNGAPVNMVLLPDLTTAHCVAWDPLVIAPADRIAVGQQVIDARDDLLSPVLDQLTAALTEAAATGAALPEADEEHERPEPTRLRYIEVISAPADSRLLILTASPWAARALTAELTVALPAVRQQIHLWLPGESEPTDGRVVVAPYGLLPKSSYTDAVLYHPPYGAGQLPAAVRVHLLWLATDWGLAEAVLGWAYPDRDALVHMYKLLRAGDASPARLAQALSELPGPWNDLRYEAASAVFRDVGLLTPSGQLQATGSKFDLDASERYRSGTAARMLLDALRTNDWTKIGQGL